MRIPRLSPAAQSTIEYIVTILVVVAVLLAAGAYYQRNLQGKYREAGDVLGGGEQSGP